MAKRGPKKQSTELKLLSNTFRPDRDCETPKPAPLMPDCPAWLPKEAKDKYKKEAPKMVSLGILTEIDADEFGRYCLFTIREAEAEQLIKKDGLLIKSARGDGQMVKNPAVQIARDYAAAASKLADKFGLNPISRNNVSVYIESDEHDPMLDLLTY